MSGNNRSRDDPAKEVLVDKVDTTYDRSDKNELHNSSVNKGSAVDVDLFLAANTAHIGSGVAGDSDIQRAKELRNSRYSIMAGDHGLSINQGALAILSTCVGGGIVGLPLAMFNLGLPLAIFLQVLVMFSTHMSSNMYLYIKDIVPDKPDSLYEIGYMIMGRKSIFILASILIINSFGLCMIYFIVFGDTAG